MPDCAVCGGTEFTPYDGYYYCTQCQTQSQDVRQLEMSFRQNTTYGFLKNTTVKKKPVKKKKRVGPLGEGPAWTSWHAFNFILKGLSEEVIALGGPAEFEKVVLQIWACYLRVNEVAFTSKWKVTEPKLSFPFRYRDGKVVYDVDTYSTYDKNRLLAAKLKTKKQIKIKKYKLKHSKKKMNITDYESHASSIEPDHLNLTLDDLHHTSDSVKEEIKAPKRKCLTKKGYEKKKRSNDTGYYCKYLLHRPTAFCIIHLALIITHSQIQLSDLMRFIREGHLSYSVLSHFLPAEVKFGRHDSKYLNCNNDCVMPTHHGQRTHLALLSSMLKFRSLPSPDFVTLLKRYAVDLLLPEQVTNLAVSLMMKRGTPEFVKRGLRETPIQSFELIAIAPILVVLKLLFGLDGVTERHASHFADTVNRLQGDAHLFSWCQWQRALECRKTVLTVWHYPTREMVDPDAFLDTKDSCRFLKNTHKDPYITERMFPIKLNPKLPKNMEKGVEDAMKEIVDPTATDAFPIFQPSLTPGITLLQDVVSWLRAMGKPDPPWLPILDQDWNSFSVDYLLNTEPFLPILEAHGIKIDRLPAEWLVNHMSRATWLFDKLDLLTEGQQANKFEVILATQPDPVGKKHSKKKINLYEPPRENTAVLRSGHKYWRLTPPDERFYRGVCWEINEFEREVMPKFPSSWAWLLTQCSYMLHVLTRDIYEEVLLLEDALIQTMTSPSKVIK